MTDPRPKKRRPVPMVAPIVVTCAQTGKSRFASRRLAKRSARRECLRGVRPYRCRSCGGWHVGHETADGRAALRENGL